MKDAINEQLDGLENTLDTLEQMVERLEDKLRDLIDQKIKIAESIEIFTKASKAPTLQEIKDEEHARAMEAHWQREQAADKYGIANEIANDYVGEF